MGNGVKEFVNRTLRELKRGKNYELYAVEKGGNEEVFNN